MSEAMVFVSSSPFRVEHPSTLALYCSDGRFAGAVEEFARHLGHDRLDVLAIPGGPTLLHPSWAVRFFESDTVCSALDFLVEAHRIADVLLLAHEGCGYYRARYPGDSDEDRVRRQHVDLTAAARVVRARHTQANVSAYFMRVEGGHVAFHRVLV